MISKLSTNHDRVFSKLIERITDSVAVDNKLIPFLFLLSFSICLPTVFAFLFGVSGIDAAKFFIYALIYHGLNGYLVLTLLSQRIQTNMLIPIILAIGIGYNFISFYTLSFFHLQQYSYLNLILILTISFFKTTFAKRGTIGFQLTSYSSNPYSYSTYDLNIIKTSLILFLFLFIVFFDGLPFFLNNDLDYHFNLQGAFATSMAYLPYPFSEPRNPEISLYYNYVYHAEMAFCHLCTSIPMKALANRVYPIYIFYLAIWTIYSFCKEHFEGKDFTAWLTVIFSLCVIGFSSWSTSLFGNPIPSSSTYVGSSALGFIYFFILTEKVMDFYESPKPSFLDWAFISLIFFIGSVARSAVPLIFIGGISLFLIREYFSFSVNRPLIRLFFLILLMSLLFITALFSAYGLFSSTSATDFVEFTQNIDFCLFSIGKWLPLYFPTLFKSLPELGFGLASLLLLLLTPGYLMIGFILQVKKFFKERIRNLDFLLFAFAFTAAIITNCTLAPGSSHYSFYFYTILPFSMFGAQGTYLLFKDYALLKKNSLLFLCLTSILIFLVKGYELFYEIRKEKLLTSVSFLSNPLFTSLSQDLLDLLNTITLPVEKTIAVCLINNLKEEDALALYIQLKGIPLYQQTLLNDTVYPHYAAFNNRVYSLIDSLTVSEIDDTFIEKWKSLQPHKNIIFIAKKNMNISTKNSFIIYNSRYHNIVIYVDGNSS